MRYRFLPKNALRGVVNYTEMVYLSAVIHPSSNRARRGAATLIEINFTQPVV